MLLLIPFMPKVKVDENECTGCGLCYNDECPDVFVEGSDGISELKPSFQKGGVHQGVVDMPVVIASGRFIDKGRTKSVYKVKGLASGGAA